MDVERDEEAEPQGGWEWVKTQEEKRKKEREEVCRRAIHWSCLQDIFVFSCLVFQSSYLFMVSVKSVRKVPRLFARFSCVEWFPAFSAVDHFPAFLNGCRAELLNLSGGPRRILSFMINLKKCVLVTDDRSSTVCSIPERSIRVQLFSINSVLSTVCFVLEPGRNERELFFEMGNYLEKRKRGVTWGLSYSLVSVPSTSPFRGYLQFFFLY